MPRIFDNIQEKLLKNLQQTLQESYRSDFCIGYFELSGWKVLQDYVESWQGGEDACCRVLVGMQKLPQEEARALRRLQSDEQEMDNQTALRLKRRLAEEFRMQLAESLPTNAEEATLRKLAAQLRAGKVCVKLFSRHRLHAKLYLLYRQDHVTPIIGYLGSSNLTLSGLSSQGELNIDVVEQDACKKLEKWFNDRWNDRWCMDISADLAQIIEESWARESLILPYHIYIKMAYHLSQEARSGLTQFRIPRDFGNRLFDFQTAAVKIAAHHLNKRGGVLIGDVVGLGKTLMATALARIFEDDFDLETLIICPKNLVKMWESYRDQYRLRARVLSVSRVLQELPDMRRYRIVVLDESHNLRNREGKRYKVIRDYIQNNESRCILLSATPYNKTYLDLSNQLRLFVTEDKNLGLRPERLLREMGGETQFVQRHDCPINSLAAFEKSIFPDDWRELMRLYMVRRTRSFIINNYAQTDPGNGRKYLLLEDGTFSYFPVRLPRTVKFQSSEDDPNDPYARLYSEEVVNLINQLSLPRYGLGNYILTAPKTPPTSAEKAIIENLSRAGRSLMGFCRTNLFKRLESSGQVFIESIERHIVRNYIFLHALENNLPLPVGTQDAGLLDMRLNDEDTERLDFIDDVSDGEDESVDEMIQADLEAPQAHAHSEADYQRQAAQIYQTYATAYQRRFKWISAHLFTKDLAKGLLNDARCLIGLLQKFGCWDPQKDYKLQGLLHLVKEAHPDEKILLFTQFADTVNYLVDSLQQAGVQQCAGAVGGAADPTALAWRFSPQSNQVSDQICPEEELRVLIATDVLSEGQNLQDARIVVNYDLPWAIVRLIQRAGRVDRIGQHAEETLCYSFLPVEGVERIIRLRQRVRQRLRENAEVVGTDEAFFEEEPNTNVMKDLYNEKAGILDGDEDDEVDLSSYAYQIWQNAISRDPSLQRAIPNLPPVAYAARQHIAYPGAPGGALVYLRTEDGGDALSWMSSDGESVTQSQFEILRAAECAPDTPPQPRPENHHELVRRSVEQIMQAERLVGGQLGRPSGARFRTYERLKRFVEQNDGTLFITQDLRRAVDEIYRYPLRESAKDNLNRQLRSGIQDQQLAEMVVSLRAEDRLCVMEDDEPEEQGPKIVCSMGLSETIQGEDRTC